MIKRLIGIVSIVVVIILGFIIYSVLKPPAEASGPITAIPITVDPNTSTAGSGGATATPAASNSSATTAPAATPSAGSGTVIYQIVPADSSASFTVGEVLNGSPNTVVGTSNQVAGQIALDQNNPASAQIGPIQVDARTLVTDNNFRNRAIANQILDTNNYEYITFTPKTLSGLPDQITYGTSYTFKISGDLTIKGVTQQVTFDATVTPVDATHLKGSATTTVLYKDFGISIPQVRSVASVDNQVVLKIDFVATPK
jgi:polyisoprenoid-binding protein YceI